MNFAAVLITWLALIVPTVTSETTATRDLRATQIATRYWGGTRCTDVIEIKKRELPYSTLGLANWKLALSSRTIYNSCFIEVNSRRVFNWRQFCAIIVHEYGHLNGKPHSSNPYSIMYPMLTDKNIPRMCRA